MIRADTAKEHLIQEVETLRRQAGELEVIEAAKNQEDFKLGNNGKSSHPGDEKITRPEETGAQEESFSYLALATDGIYLTDLRGVYRYGITCQVQVS